jgi:hypothetical protein
MTDMAFLTPRETVALTALANGSPMTIGDLSQALTQMAGRDIGPEATAALARSLVGQRMAERSGTEGLELYRATAEGQAWLEAYGGS